MRQSVIFYAIFAMLATSAIGAPVTTYTLPQDLNWKTYSGPDVGAGVQLAMLHGKLSDKCGALYLWKFPDGYVTPWHVNGGYSIYTILKGTLVLGFGRRHAKVAERAFPPGSIIQGLGTEPHYGRAVGQTIFEVYDVCSPAASSSRK
ncbi:MAG: hypothetical protein WAL67_07470 [Candidatus Cybelea sp.]